jgi:hypothetical protein
MRTTIWLRTRADAFMLDAQEAERIANKFPDNDTRSKDARRRADIYRTVADELRCCANEFPDHLDLEPSR